MARGSETPKARAAWEIYRDLGPDRSLEQVRERLGRPPSYRRQLELWSSRYRWQERVVSHDQAELRAGLGARNVLRERALQELVEAASEASRVVLAVLRDQRTVPIMDRHGEQVGERPLVAPSTKLQAAQWIHGVCGIVPTKRIELRQEPDTLIEQADNLTAQATTEQLFELIKLLKIVEDQNGDDGASA